jgi:isoleucyl-tRNA synthetase
MAPVLSFTADEAWPIFTRNPKDSVLLHTWHAFPDTGSDLCERWDQIRAVRSEVQKEIETLRAAGKIGSSLQAEVEVHATGDRFQLLQSLDDDLRFVFITSQARVAQSAGEVIIHPSPYRKCERCWHYRADVGSNPAHADICSRCTQNLYGPGERRIYA